MLFATKIITIIQRKANLTSWAKPIYRLLKSIQTTTLLKNRLN